MSFRTMLHKKMEMVNLQAFVFVISVIIGICDAKKILAVFPVPSISHQVVFRPITQELVRRGHEVTVITTDPVFPKEEALKNLTEIDVHDLSYKIWESFYASSTGSSKDVYEQYRLGFKIVMDVCEAQLNSEQVKELLNKRSDYFDLIIIEALARPAYVFTHFFKAPSVLITSLGIYLGQFEIFGIPTHYSSYPIVTRQKINNLTISEKFFEIYRELKLLKIINDYQPKEDEMLQKNFGSNVPALEDLKNNFDMFFVNEYPIWDSNRPVPPSVVYMGGLHQKPHSELPQDLEKYLDESKNGVIYISFGTNVSPSTLPAEKIRTIVNAFSKMPYNVLWKWDKDVLPGQSKNIKIGKWFPQSDLLKHPNIKLFITQGGLQSTDEAITAGVPLLGMPMLGDQWYNVEKYISLKIGQRLDLEHVTEKKLKNIIENIVTDKSYRENIKDLRDKMQDQPMSSLDRTIWWMEYVIRYKGARHLRSPAAGISWAEYLELPLLLTVLSVILAVILTVTLSIVYVYKHILSNKSKLRKKIKIKSQ